MSSIFKYICNRYPIAACGAGANDYFQKYSQKKPLNVITSKTNELFNGKIDFEKFIDEFNDKLTFGSKNIDPKLQRIIDHLRKNDEVDALWRRVEKIFQEQINVIFVDPSQTPFGAESEFQYDGRIRNGEMIIDKIYNPTISLSNKDDEFTLTSSVLFELINISRVDERNELVKKALTGKFTIDQYTDAWEFEEFEVGDLFIELYEKCKTQNLVPQNSVARHLDEKSQSLHRKDRYQRGLQCEKDGHCKFKKF